VIIDARKPAELANEISAQIVIVGAGTVGLYLAEALASSRPKADIVIVEAGPSVPITARNIHDSVSVGKAHEGTHLGRASGLGGTSSLWGGQLAEFGRQDLERPGSAWPISYEELQEAYKVVYERLDIGSPKPVNHYRREFGGETDSAGPVERFFTYWLEQPNFGTFYRGFIKYNPAVRIILNLTAHRAEFDGSRARCLVCSTDSGRRVRIHAGQIVFASGTIASSRFFLSTQRVGGVPWVDNDNIGKYFQDHLGGRIARATILDERLFRDYFENGWVDGIKLQPKLTLSEPRRREMNSGACGFFTFDSSVAENLANLKRTIRGMQAGLSFSTITSRVSDVFALGRSVLPIVSRYMRRRRIFALFDQGLHLNVQAEQIPVPDSRIRLLDGALLADGMYRVAVDWRCSGLELDTIHALATDAASYLTRRGLARLDIDPALLRKDRAFIDTLGDTYHQCGGLRMSTGPATGVVNEDGLVWGTSNFWVTGAAVLPSSSHANCTLTALALASRLSARLI